MASMIKLGNKYKDNVHGLEGVAVAHTKHLTGCDRILLEYIQGGEIKEVWFDIVSLVGVKTPAAAAGGPNKTPPSKHQ